MSTHEYQYMVSALLYSISVACIRAIQQESVHYCFVPIALRYSDRHHLILCNCLNLRNTSQGPQLLHIYRHSVRQIQTCSIVESKHMSHISLFACYCLWDALVLSILHLCRTIQQHVHKFNLYRCKPMLKKKE